MPGRLFRVGQGSLLTELMAGVTGESGIDCSRLRDDSTSVSACGAHKAADGEDAAGTPAPAVTRGHPEDHRPDLKQLALILTVSGDHAVPVTCRLADGNTGWRTGTPAATRPASPPGTSRPERGQARVSSSQSKTTWLRVCGAIGASWYSAPSATVKVWNCLGMPAGSRS
jgi:hypothetical protein